MATAKTVHCTDCGSQISTDAEVCPSCGVRQTKAQGDGKEPSGRYIAAIIGAVSSLFLGWVPLVGPILSGAVAGYLRGQDTKESAITGALANVFASIPMVLIVVLFLGLGTLGAILEGDGQAGVGLIVWLVIFAVSFAYYYGFGALGGYIGGSMSDREAP